MISALEVSESRFSLEGATVYFTIGTSRRNTAKLVNTFARPSGLWASRGAHLIRIGRGIQATGPCMFRHISWLRKRTKVNDVGADDNAGRMEHGNGSHKASTS